MENSIGPSEHQIQSACFDWVRIKEKSDPRFQMIYAIPNGGRRDIITAAKMKREGAKAGVWDISVDISRAGFNGLKIEVKKPGGKLSDSQKIMGELYVRFGYAVSVVYSVEEFIRTVEGYFKGED